MKKKLLTISVLIGLSAPVWAQTDFEHSQTRIQEAMSEFFVRPMVAELKMINEECQEYGPFNVYQGVSVESMNNDDLTNAKSNAAYRAAKIAGADIILGATFHVTNNKTKNKGLDVIVKGYPAKYVNFHSYGDPQKGKDDDKWVAPLQEGAKIRTLNGQNQTKALSNDTRNK